MSLSLSKVFRGVVNIDFRDSVADASRYALTGVKAEIPQLSLTPKEDTYELADGRELTDDKGTTGEFVIEHEEIDATDWATLTTYKPGATNGIDQVVVTFPQLGTGSDHYITINDVVGLVKGMLTGKAWKTSLKLKISLAAGEALEDHIIPTHP